MYSDLVSTADGGGQPLISPAEVAILETMMDGGYRLSLKAHFLPAIPPLSPLSLTLTHLNLSFNNLDVSTTKQGLFIGPLHICEAFSGVSLWSDGDDSTAKLENEE